MARKVRVLTTSFAHSRTATIAENRELAARYVDAAGAENADLVCLPENFLLTNVPRAPLRQAEPIDGPTFAALGALARKHRTWVVGGWLTRSEDGDVRNSAVVIDRGGRLAASYAKVHPTIPECESGIVPGGDATVVDTDFGRLGLAICFDIGWPEHWAALDAAGAELVVWPSAYDGGFPLRAYAWSHQYYIVSAVRTAHSRVIDVTGRVLTSTSEWSRLAATTVALEKTVFHIDEQVDTLNRLARELGSRVTVEAFSEENIFTVESNDPDWPLARIVERYGLESFRDYHARSTWVQEKHRTARP